MNNQQKLIILAAVVGVSAIGLLLILSRKKTTDGLEHGENEEELEFADLTANDLMTAGASETIVQVKVPQYAVGSIIGKGGQNIRQLKKETGARLDFEKEKEEQEKNRDGSGERILEIRGERQKVYDAEMKIRKIIEETPQNITVELSVPQKACGRIIGRGGQTIREMCRISKARILVESTEDRSSIGMRTIKITGTPQQVDYAKGLIEEKVEIEKLMGGKFQKAKSSVKQEQWQKNGSTKYNYQRKKLPAEDGFFQVFVSAFDVPSHIFIQLVTSESPRLDQLTQDMTDYYTDNDHSQSKQLMNGVSVGNVYCAPFEFDDLWYRACVLEIDSNDRMATVYYIDFGDSGKVSLDDLKQPKPEFLELEAQAIECCLAGVSPKDGEWCENAIKRFEDLSQCAQWSVLMARITGYQETVNGILPCLELIDTKHDEEVNIAETLIKEGFAIAYSASSDSNEMKSRDQIKNDQKAANNNTNISTKESKDIAEEQEVQSRMEKMQSEGKVIEDLEAMPDLVDIYDPKRDSVDVSSISSASTEDTVIHVAAKVAEQAPLHDVITDESVPANKAGRLEALSNGENVNGNVGEIVSSAELQTQHSDAGHVATEVNVMNEDHSAAEAVKDGSGIRQKIKSSNQEVNKWIERSSRIGQEAGSAGQGSPGQGSRGQRSPGQGSPERSVYPMHVDAGLSEEDHDTVKSAAVRLSFQNSLELSKENPLMLSDDEDSMSYMSARSEMTIASNSQDTDADTLSFKSAPDTPTNSNTFDFPIQRDSDVEYDIIKTPVGSDDEILNRPFSSVPIENQNATPSNTSASKYQIKIIDETPKAMAGSLETLQGGYTPNSHGNSDANKLSSSPQRISQLSTSSPQFGELRQSQSRFGGSGSIGKETSI